MFLYHCTGPRDVHRCWHCTSSTPGVLSTQSTQLLLLLKFVVQVFHQRSANHHIFAVGGSTPEISSKFWPNIIVSVWNYRTFNDSKCPPSAAMMAGVLWQKYLKKFDENRILPQIRRYIIQISESCIKWAELRWISHYLLQRFSASLQDFWTINLATEQRFSFPTTRFEVFRVGLQEHIAGATATHSDGLTAGDERLLAARNIPMLGIA